MMLKLIVLAALFLAVWAGVYPWLRKSAAASTPTRPSDYRQWIQASLADMFYTVSDRRIVQTLTGLVVTGAVLGFFLPGKSVPCLRKRRIKFVFFF